MKLRKETKRGEGAGKHGKWYADACGTAFALELIGERWSLLIVRELMLGPLRFSELRVSLPGISAKVLTERLESLEDAGVLIRRKLPPPASVQVYELTEWGYLAEPAIQELGRWAARSPLHDPTLPISPVSMMLSMRTMIDHEAAKAFDAEVGLFMGDDRFIAHLKNGILPIERARGGEKLDIAFHVPMPGIIGAMIYAKMPFAQLEAEAGLMIEGDRALAERFVDLFSLPPKVG